MRYVLFIAALFPIYVTAACFDISVNVQQRKQNGGSWDGLYVTTKPNIALCIHDSLGYRCKLDAGNPNNHKSLCGDSFTCVYKSVYLPDSEFTVEVLDLDPRNKIEKIGKVLCKRGEHCPVGVSEVEFQSAKCNAPIE